MPDIPGAFTKQEWTLGDPTGPRQGPLEFAQQVAFSDDSQKLTLIFWRPPGTRIERRVWDASPRKE